MLTAGAPTTALIAALDRSGWQALAGPSWHGLRVCLRSLASLLPAKSGQGETTRWQVADRMGGYSIRHVSRLLAELELLEIITWRRGGVVSGRPQPSYFRVNKTVLLAMVEAGRIRLTEVLARRRAATETRLRGLRMLNVRPRIKSPRKLHEDIRSPLPPYRGNDVREARPSIQPRKDSSAVRSHGMVYCDVKGCKEAAYDKAADGWTTDAGRDYCSSHAKRLALAEKPTTPNDSQSRQDSKDLSQAEIDRMSPRLLATLNRARARRGLPAYVQTAEGN